MSTDKFKGCNIYFKIAELLHTINISNGLYPFPSLTIATKHQALSSNINLYAKWHRISGHVGETRMTRATELVNGIDKIDVSLTKEHQCINLLELGKKPAPIPLPVPIFSDKLEQTHTDISGKISNTSYGGYQ